MQTRHHIAIFGMVAMMAISYQTPGQSLEALRDARDQAKADLIKAQEVFDRADDAYIKALGGAAAKSAVISPEPPIRGAASPAAAAQATAVPATTAQPVATSAQAETPPASEVTFSLSGIGAIEVSPLDYRARLIVDQRPTEWTQHASGVKIAVSSGTKSLAYEVQNNPKSDVANPAWKTVCQGTLSLKPRLTVDIAIDHGVTCAAK